MPDLMTTREVADYLRIKERKVYDLLREGRIPSTRVTGKWLFPKHLVDLWLARGTDLSGIPEGAPGEVPRVVAGSHDPLLDWALRESGSDLASMFRGSLDGLDRVAAGEAMVAGLHVFEPETESYNIESVKAACSRLDVVLIRWARREQGLVVAPGNPLGLSGLADVAGAKARVAVRQGGAGSQILLTHLLAKEGLTLADLTVSERPALNETDLCAAIMEGRADTGLAVASAALQYRLDFVPQQVECYDLLIGRRFYFEEPVQKLLAVTRAPSFGARAAALGGYDVGAFGEVVFNSP